MQVVVLTQAVPAALQVCRLLLVHWNEPGVQIIASQVPLVELQAWLELHVTWSQPVRLLLHFCSSLPAHLYSLTAQAGALHVASTLVLTAG